ncbi:MAG: PilN domain-containing protein [Candidatus Aminicenantes bacterium]|nr:PilN domain-containing protein [Candidatus Aminicenantes bacterium]
MIRINLLKPEKKEIRETAIAPTPEFKEKKKQPYFALLILVAIIAAAALFFYQRSAIAREHKLLSAAQAEKKSLQDVVAKLDELEQQRNLFQRKISVITQLQSRQQNAVIIMDELSKNLPNWIWLTEVSYSNMEIRIKGRAVSNNLLADYIYNLEKSPSFRSVRLVSSTQRRVRNNQYLEFSLTASYVGKASEDSSPEREMEGEGQ